MATNPVKRKWTVEEYIAYELETGIKHEYIDGDIFAMAGATEKHNRIKRKTQFALEKQLEEASDCELYDSDTRIKISDIVYVYPDITVLYGEAIFADKDEMMLTNPRLVIEVLSPSTSNYDKGAKADYYRSLPSVQAYLLLEQDRPFVQLYTRSTLRWELEEFSGLDAFVPLNSIGCSLPLSEAYRNVEFEEK